MERTLSHVPSPQRTDLKMSASVGRCPTLSNAVRHYPPQQILLKKNAARVSAASGSGGVNVITLRSTLRSVTWWLITGLAAAYALVAVTDEEVSYYFGGGRVLLASVAASRVFSGVVLGAKICAQLAWHLSEPVCDFC